MEDKTFVVVVVVKNSVFDGILFLQFFEMKFKVGILRF